MALGTIGSATGQITVNNVGEAWKQENASSYVFHRLPQAKVLDKRVGHTGTAVYPLPDLASFMLTGNGLPGWDPGDTPPASRKLDSSNVTIATYGKGTPFAIDRPLDRPVAHRMTDLETNIVNGELGMLYQGHELAMVNFLFNGSNFSSKTWSGTNALDTYASDHTPLKDLQVALLPLRKYQARAGFTLECVVDQRVLTILRMYLDIHGAGEGSSTFSAASDPQVLAALKSALNLDDIHVITTISNTAKAGQTAALAEIGGGGLGFYIFDRRKSVFDLTYSESRDAPDGAYVMAMGTKGPYVHNWANEGAEVEYFHGRTTFGIISPRGSSHGIFYPSSQNLS